MMYKSNERLDHSQDLKLKKLAEYAKKPGSSKWFHANSGVPFKTLMDSFKSTLPDRPTIKRQHNLSSHEPQLTKGYTQNNFQIIENKLKSSINKGSGDLHVGHCYKLTPKDSKSKVDDALNYLKLREIGCSKEEAIVFCNRDRCTHRAAEFELPARLRNSQSSRSLISQDTTKYKTFNSKVDKESFKSVDRALTNYLISHNHEPEPFMKSFMVENNYETEPSSPMKKRESFFSEDLQQISMFDFKSPFKTFLEKFIYNRSEIIPKTPIQQDKIVDEIIEDFVNEPSIKIS